MRGYEPLYLYTFVSRKPLEADRPDLRAPISYR
jgi:hypothetical protein